MSLAATDSSNSVMGFMGVMGAEGRRREPFKRETVKQEGRGDRSQVERMVGVEQGAKETSGREEKKSKAILHSVK